MSPEIVALVLAAAVLHAVWNAMAKSGGSPAFSIAAYQLVGGVICLALAWLVPFPAAAAWPWIIASVLIHNVYYFTLSMSYRSGDLSLVYPLFRGLAPVLVALGAAFVANEHLPPDALVGVVLVSVGLLALSFLGSPGSRPSRAALFWGLSTALMIAAYTVVDGSGVRRVDNSLSYILWLFVLEPLPICAWILATRARDFGAYLGANTAKVLFGAIASSAAYGLVIYAMSQGAMALVSSLRETSVIFAALIGTLLLKEPFGRRRVIAACLVCLGVIVIRYHG